MNLVALSAQVKRGVIILIALVSIYIFYLLAKAPVQSLFSTLFPEKDVANPAFGLLEPVKFIPVEISSANPEFVLNTTTGSLPGGIPDKLPVFKYIQPTFSLNAGREAQNNADFLGYTEEDLRSDLKGEVFQWIDSDYGGRLKININTKQIELTTPYAGHSQLFPVGKINNITARSIASNLFENLDMYDPKLYSKSDVFAENIKVELGKYVGSTRVIETQLQVEAQMARVDFFRSIDNVPILGPDPTIGYLHTVVRNPVFEGSNESPELNYPEIKAFHWDIDPITESTYPIIPVSAAWSQVANNNGVIVNVSPKIRSPFEEYQPTRVDRILINDVYIAYYDYPEQSYLQPIYVFEGDYTSTGGGSGKISVYYPAISSVYLKKSDNTQAKPPERGINPDDIIQTPSEEAGFDESPSQDSPVPVPEFLK